MKCKKTCKSKKSKLKALIAIKIILLVLLFLRNKGKEKRLKENFPPIGNFIESHGCNIHYFSQGEGENIVLLHGKEGSLFDFYLSDFWKKLTKKYKVTAIDLAGYGNSSRENYKNYGFKNQSILIEDILEKLEVKNPILLGYEESCGIILNMVINKPNNYASAILINDGLPEKISFYEKFLDLPILGDILLWTSLPIIKELKLSCIKENLSSEYKEKIALDTSIKHIKTAYENKKYMNLNELEFNLAEKVKTPIKVISSISSRKTPNIMNFTKKYFENIENKYLGNYNSLDALLNSDVFFELFI
ncbi:MAG: alpha/beta hydrolase [Candidatus Sericytochromatia bacterium]